MTRTSLIYVASAVLGVAAGIATLAGVQSGRTSGNDILLACRPNDPDCFQPGHIGAPCPASDPRCDNVQPTEQIEVACNSPSCGGDYRSDENVEVACDGPDCDGGYRSDANIRIASANRGVEGGNG